MPIVPVVSFWSTDTDISSIDLTAALSGRGHAGQKVAVLASDADAIAAALNIALGGSVVRASTVQNVRAAVRQGALGLLRAGDVDPSVRALSIDGKALFGEQHITSLADWAMTATVKAPSGQGWDLASTWTMVAAGDMFMDRGVHRTIVDEGRGLNYPLDGGTAIVTGHHCCGVYVTIHPIPDIKFTGHAGVVRALLQNADLAVANLETPVPDNWVYHAHDYIFSSDPSLLPMFTNAGIDFLTIANNHMKDFGGQGIADTRKNLAAAGIKFAGAGANLAEAGQIAYLHAKGTTVAIIACQWVEPGYFATRTKAGTLPCGKHTIVPLIHQAKLQADLVVVFAHWGTEYDRNPQPGTRLLAKAWADAGAGLILGSHIHEPGAIEDINGTVVFYSLGNFVFDQNWWTDTMESFLPEMTFEGNRLVQVVLHPYVVPDQQPNLLNPATDDGAAILQSTRAISAAIGLNW